jgi:hypothetical protein
MGKPCLDCNGCAYGQRFDIETKAPGEKPTPRQWNTIEELIASGSRVFVIDGSSDDSYQSLELWLAQAAIGIKGEINGP